MVTLEDLLTCLKTKGCFPACDENLQTDHEAQLLAIDNATLFPLKRENVMLLFKLVNEFRKRHRLSLQPTTPLQNDW